MTKEPPVDDLTTPEGERSVLPQTEALRESDPRAEVPKELALREREVLPEVVRGVEMMLAEAMYPERVLRFPDESVGEVRWCALGGDWDESPEGRASALGEVRIPAGRRALLQLRSVESAEFLWEVREGDLQGVWEEGEQRLTPKRSIVASLIERGFGRQIEELKLRFVACSDLVPLRGLANLQTLVLWDTVVTDVGPLYGLMNLRTLVVALTSLTDVSPLHGLTNLRELNLIMTRVTDVSPLRNLTCLQKLILSYTGVSDVSPLQGLTSLQELDISYTRVTDVSPLRGLANLQIRDLYSGRPRGIR